LVFSTAQFTGNRQNAGSVSHRRNPARQWIDIAQAPVRAKRSVYRNHGPPMPDHPSSTTDDRIVHLHTRRQYRAAGSNATPPAPSGDLDRFAQSGEPDDFRHRMTVNAVAFLFVVALVVAGVWLAITLANMRKTQDCVISGKRGCGPVETSAPAGRQ
jgi:hypothetical protein